MKAKQNRRILELFGQMILAFERLSAEERASLETHERANADGCGAITWPGWNRHFDRKLPSKLINALKQERRRA